MLHLFQSVDDRARLRTAGTGRSGRTVATHRLVERTWHGRRSRARFIAARMVRVATVTGHQRRRQRPESQIASVTTDRRDLNGMKRSTPTRRIRPITEMMIETTISTLYLFIIDYTWSCW